MWSAKHSVKHGASHTNVASRSQHIDRTSSTRFDESSGQIFTETEVYFNSKQRSDWIGEFKNPQLLERNRPNEHRARTLLEMAKRKTARQFRDLSSNHFSVVPWETASKVWDEVRAIRAESFHAWRVMAESYPSDMEFGKPEYQYVLEIRKPSLSLQEYFRGIESRHNAWLTCLRISPKQTSLIDLVALASIKNLAVLDLSDGQVMIANSRSNFDERIMRTWAGLAEGGQCFHNLRVLMFGWQEHLSLWIFKYLDHFPSLCYVITTDCPNMHQRNREDWMSLASGHGWESRHSKRSAKSLRPILNNKDSYLGSVSGLLYDSQSLHEKLSEYQKMPVNEIKPVLECVIGTPKRWTHIIDDFPGNRTIFFEKRIAEAIEGPDVINVRPVQSEQPKRLREGENQPAETRSPPPKRVLNPGRKHRATVSSLDKALRELTGS